jgi:hypothetical protein
MLSEIFLEVVAKDEAIAKVVPRPAFVLSFEWLGRKENDRQDDP